MDLFLQLVASFFLLFSTSTSASPTSSCYEGSATLDWYIDAVGETPCMPAFVRPFTIAHLRICRHDVSKVEANMQHRL